MSNTNLFEMYLAQVVTEFGYADAEVADMSDHIEIIWSDINKRCREVFTHEQVNAGTITEDQELAIANDNVTLGIIFHQRVYLMPDAVMTFTCADVQAECTTVSVVQRNAQGITITAYDPFSDDLIDKQSAANINDCSAIIRENLLNTF